MQRILGIDPGLLHTGWGIIEKQTGEALRYIACGVIKPLASLPFELRLKQIYSGVIKIIEEFAPNEAAMEEVFINKNPNSSKKLIMARTAAMLACINSDLPFSEFLPVTIKKNVTGNGKAQKTQVYTMVQQILGVSFPKDKIEKTFDSMDALAIAICQEFSKFSKSVIMRGK